MLTWKGRLAWLVLIICFDSGFDAGFDACTCCLECFLVGCTKLKSSKKHKTLGGRALLMFGRIWA